MVYGVGVGGWRGGLVRDDDDVEGEGGVVWLAFQPSKPSPPLADRRMKSAVKGGCIVCCLWAGRGVLCDEVE